MARANILVVDDEPLIGTIFVEYLQERGYAVVNAGDAREALQQAGSGLYDLIFLDIKMPGMDGVEALEEIKKLQPAARVILMTGYWDQTRYLQKQAEEIGIYRILEKPFDIADILPLIEEALGTSPE